jgi:hypothetical protein
MNITESIMAASKRRSFDVASLFNGGVGGVYYPLANEVDDDPFNSDVYTDSGASNIAIFGGAIATVLDRRNKNITVGDELVVNNEFSSSANWTLGAGWSITGNQLVCDTLLAFNSASQSIPSLEVGKYYRVVIDYAEVTANAPQVWLGNSGGAFAGVSYLPFVTVGSTGMFASFIMFNVPTAKQILIRSSGSGLSCKINSISVREISCAPIIQWSSPALTPIYGRSPANRRNILRHTEEFNQSIWVKSNTTVSEDVSISPDGTLTADKLVENTANAQHVISHAIPVIAGVTYTFSVYAKASERRRFNLRFGSSAPNDAATFDVISGTIVSSTNGSAAMVDIGNGWYRCSLTSTVVTGGARSHFIVLNTDSGSGLQTYVGDGSSGILLWGAQLEVSNAVTNYQRGGALAVTTEVGVPSYPLLRFDGDDRLEVSLSQDINGTIVIAGKNSSVIEPVSYTYATRFILGTNSYTNGESGVLRAIGDVLGALIIDRVLSESEKEKVLKYFKKRGAKGFLVESDTQLVNNGTFDTNLTGWDISFSTAPATVVWDDGRALFVTDGSAIARMRQLVTVVIGRSYRISRSGNAQLFAGTAAGGSQYGSVASGSSLVFTATTVNLWLSYTTSVNGAFDDNVSVKEIRAEEDWL